MTVFWRNDEALRRRDDAQALLRADGPALDVAALPSFGFGHRSLMWWGTLGLMAIEGTVFALCIAAWFYLRSRNDIWPPGPPPDWTWGLANSALMLASLWPNHCAKRAAERLDLPAARRWLVVMTAVGLAVLAVRWAEFEHLNTHWAADAYGSVVFLLLGLHTVHLITDTWDTAVLTLLMHRGPVEGRRFVDVSENALYWMFVVVSWLPVWAVLYAAPRAL